MAETTQIAVDEELNTQQVNEATIKIPHLTQAELRELARILYEMLRQDLALEQNRMRR